jgi:hypothetical protein
MAFLSQRDRAKSLSEFRALAIDSNNVFFLFRLDTLDGAQNFISDPSAAKAGETSCPNMR